MNTISSAWPKHPTSSSDHATPAQVAAAVMAVLREMSASKPSEPSVLGLHSLPEAIQPGPDAVVKSNTQAFAGSLILERHAVDLPAGVSELAIAPKTVVTPLAREILKKRGITLRWAGAANWPGQGGQNAGEWAVLRISGSAQALAVESTLAGRSGEGWDLVGPTLQAASTWLVQKPHRHLAVLSDVACISVWQLNQAGLRATEIRSSVELERVVQQFAPQCIVVEPPKLPIHEARQIFHSWRRLGVVPVPASIKDFLTGASREARA